MKKRLTRILGVVLTLVLLSSLCVFTAPVSADPGNVEWDSQSIPSATGRVLTTPGARLGPIEQNSNGSAMYAYDSSGTLNRDLFKSTDGGRTWSVTGFNYPGVIVAIATSPSEPDVVYVATARALVVGPPVAIVPSTIYKSVDGGANFPNLVATAPLDAVFGLPSNILALDVVKVGANYALVVGTSGLLLNSGDVWTLDESALFPVWQNQGFDNAFQLIPGTPAVDMVVAVAFTPDTTVGLSIVAIGVDTAIPFTYVSIFSSGAWGGVIGNAVDITPPLPAPFIPIFGLATMGDIAFPDGFNLATNPNFFFGINDLLDFLPPLIF